MNNDNDNDDGGYVDCFDLSIVRSAVEFGYKGCEKGYNLQKVLNDFDKFMSKR